MEEFKAIWDLVQTAGLGGTFAFMWWLERRERLRISKEKDNMAKEVVEAMKDNTTVLGALKDVVGVGRRR